MKTVLIIAVALAAAAWGSPPTYKFVDAWGWLGNGNGKFEKPTDVSLASNGNFYVADTVNHRVQYFRWSGVAVSPASLGRVKALFK
ncbi:MAG: hypothetical protein V3W11_06545 [bacterium]